MGLAGEELQLSEYRFRMAGTLSGGTVSQSEAESLQLPRNTDVARWQGP